MLLVCSLLPSENFVKWIPINFKLTDRVVIDNYHEEVDLSFLSNAAKITFNENCHVTLQSLTHMPMIHIDLRARIDNEESIDADLERANKSDYKKFNKFSQRYFFNRIFYSYGLTIQSLDLFLTDPSKTRLFRSRKELLKKETKTGASLSGRKSKTMVKKRKYRPYVHDSQQLIMVNSIMEDYDLTISFYNKFSDMNLGIVPYRKFSMVNDSRINSSTRIVCYVSTIIYDNRQQLGLHENAYYEKDIAMYEHGKIQVSLEFIFVELSRNFYLNQEVDIIIDGPCYLMSESNLTSNDFCLTFLTITDVSQFERPTYMLTKMEAEHLLRKWVVELPVRFVLKKISFLKPGLFNENKNVILHEL